MQNQTHDTLSELHYFVEHQAAEDAVLTPSERQYQAELVTDVLKQEPLKPEVLKSLVHDYSLGVAQHLKVQQVKV